MGWLHEVAPPIGAIMIKLHFWLQGQGLILPELVGLEPAGLRPEANIHSRAEAYAMLSGSSNAGMAGGRAP